MPNFRELLQLAKSEIVEVTTEEAENLINISEEFTFSKEDLLDMKVMKVSLYKDQTKLDKALELVTELESELTTQNQLLGKVLQMKASIYLMMGKPEVIEVSKQSEEILLK